MASVSTIVEVLKEKFKDRKISVCEIGVRYGESSATLLYHLNIERYFAIDPFDSYEDYEHDGFNKIAKQMGKNFLIEHYMNNISRYVGECKFNILNKYSDDAHEQIDDKSIDFCFVDGNHRYDYVLRDLQNYFPKLKSGGIIAGDDYFMRHFRNDHLKTLKEGDYPDKMVYEAVNDFCTKNGLILKTAGIHRGYPATWYIIKE